MDVGKPGTGQIRTDVDCLPIVPHRRGDSQSRTDCQQTRRTTSETGRFRYEGHPG